MTPKGNITNFFAKLVSPVIVKHRIVATFMVVMFNLLEKCVKKIDIVLNDDI